MYKITLIIKVDGFKDIEVMETGEILENMNLKKNLENVILEKVKERKYPFGEISINLATELNGEHYDVEEFIVVVNRDYSKAAFIQ